MTYFLRRLLISVFVLYAVATLTFFMLLLTGDPVVKMLSSFGASPADIASLRHQLGYDQPVLIQYVQFIARISHGDFGSSVRFGQPSLELVLEHLPYTLWLTAFAFTLAVVFGCVIGIVSATFPDTIVDRLGVAFAVLGQSVPSFVFGPLLILALAVNLRLLPVAGVSGPESIIMPGITLALYPMARIARLLRSSMLDVSTAEYVTTARSKGLAERVVIQNHILRNALLPTLTIMGLQLGQLLGGAVVVENIFGWPGVGYFGLHALLNSDYPVIQAVIILVAAMVIVLNLVTDLLYLVADPRIRYDR